MLSKRELIVVMRRLANNEIGLIHNSQNNRNKTCELRAAEARKAVAT